MPAQNGNDRLLSAITITPVLLAASVLLAMALQWLVHGTLEIPWFIPMYSSFFALTALSMAVLAFGRYRVLHDSVSLWTGLAFSGIGIGLAFFVLGWPGLLPDGRSFLGTQPNTAGWFSPLAATFPSLLLLAAVLLPWPDARHYTNRRANLYTVGWLVFVTAVFTLLSAIDQRLPLLIDENGIFTLGLQLWNAVLILIYLTGVIFSVRYYRQTGDRMVGYVAFFQIAMVFSPLLTIVAGRRYDLWWYYARLILLGGSLTVLFGMLVEYVSLFRQLVESENRFRQLTESLPQLIWTCRPDGQCTYLSPQWVAYTGIPAEQQLGSAWLNQLHPEDRRVVTDAWHASLTAGSKFEMEYRLRRHDGAYQWFISLALPIRDSVGKITAWFGSCTDIEALKQSEAALMHYASDLERSNRDLQEFAFVASHDLQEPLRKIEAFGDMFLEQAGNLDDSQRDLLERIQSAAHRMRGMVDGMLQLSRLETHAQPIQMVNLNHVLAEVLSDLEMQVRQRGAVVETCELPVIEADRLQMRSLFQNLVGNAIKFQPEGQHPRVRICSSANGGGHVQIDIADNGIGFEQSHASHLFEPFRRLVGRNTYDGSGMGLAICRKIVERHHGSIRVESQPGQGTTFYVTLPIQQDGLMPITGRQYNHGD